MEEPVANLQFVVDAVAIGREGVRGDIGGVGDRSDVIDDDEDSFVHVLPSDALPYFSADRVEPTDKPVTVATAVAVAAVVAVAVVAVGAGGEEVIASGANVAAGADGEGSNSRGLRPDRRGNGRFYK